jgi:L-fuculose-phosphate aldolase
MRPEARAIIHAHPPALVSFSIVHKIPDTNIIPQARGVCGKIGFATYALPGSAELGEKIAAEFRDNPDYRAVIMQNHGVVLYGDDIADAYQRFETLEFCARTLLNAGILGGARTLTDAQIELHDRMLPTDHPHFAQVSYPSDERAIRADIVRMVRRACEQGLMISSYGTVSVRWKDDDFLITPPGVLRWDIAPEDIVQVRGGRVEVGKIPSRSVAMHREIYRANGRINSIILTQSPGLMGFAVSHAGFDVRTIPESWIMLKDIPTLPFGIQYDDSPAVARTLSSTPCVLIANDSAVVTGDGLLHTFDRLEVAEFTARSLIMARGLGRLHPINDEQIEDLRVAFHVE